MDEDVVIKVDHVYKNFVLPHERVGTIKGLFTSLFRKKDKKKGGMIALKDISFEVKKGEFFGIVGRNGSGKSTLLKILAGIYQPTKGGISSTGKLVPFIELGVGFNPELTGRENVYLNGAMLGFSKKKVDSIYDDVVAFAELEKFMDQKLKNYSSGMQVRLAFSMATRAEADILLVDEVLAVGDADFQRKCYSYFKELKAKNTTVIFVTHDMNAVREYCTRAMLIEDHVQEAMGDPAEIATDYSLLFMENSVENADSSGPDRRWGTSDMRISESKAKVVGDDIVVELKAKARKNFDKVLYGIHIFGEDAKEITATDNTMMIDTPYIKDIKEGDEFSIQWKVLNIFSEGRYKVTLTLADDLGDILDWYPDACRFTVRRLDRSSTSVLPPYEASFKKLK